MISSMVADQAITFVFVLEAVSLVRAAHGQHLHPVRPTCHHPRTRPRPSCGSSRRRWHPEERRRAGQIHVVTVSAAHPLRRLELVAAVAQAPRAGAAEALGDRRAAVLGGRLVLAGAVHGQDLGARSGEPPPRRRRAAPRPPSSWAEWPGRGSGRGVRAGPGAPVRTGTVKRLPPRRRPTRGAPRRHRPPAHAADVIPPSSRGVHPLGTGRQHSVTLTSLWAHEPDGPTPTGSRSAAVTSSPRETTRPRTRSPGTGGSCWSGQRLSAPCSDDPEGVEATPSSSTPRPQRLRPPPPSQPTFPRDTGDTEDLEPGQSFDPKRPRGPEPGRPRRPARAAWWW